MAADLPLASPQRSSHMSGRIRRKPLMASISCRPSEAMLPMSEAAADLQSRHACCSLHCSPAGGVWS